MTFAAFSSGIVGLINTIVVPLIFAGAFFVFIWGIFNYFILGGADETKQKEGRDFAIWGILGMVVLFSVWGLVNVLLTTFGL
jgi:hypothetical protein